MIKIETCTVLADMITYSREAQNKAQAMHPGGRWISFSDCKPPSDSEVVNTIMVSCSPYLANWSYGFWRRVED